MTKRFYSLSGIAAVAGLGLLTGCSSTPPVTNNYAPGGKESIYRTAEKSEALYRSEQAECVALFKNSKDQIGFNGSMLHLTIKPGANIPLRTATDSEIIYAAKGSGMAKLNGVAFILTEGSGLYVPKDSSLEILNNGSGDLKIMALCRQIPDIKWTTPNKPLVFDAKEAAQSVTQTATGVEKSNEDANVKKLIPTVPGKLSGDNIKPETLTPDENKINPPTQKSFK